MDVPPLNASIEMPRERSFQNKYTTDQEVVQHEISAFSSRKSPGVSERAI
jgi:hypothetical protein